MRKCGCMKNFRYEFQSKGWSWSGYHRMLLLRQLMQEGITDISYAFMTHNEALRVTHCN